MTNLFSFSLDFLPSSWFHSSDGSVCRIRRSTLLRLRLLSLPEFRLSDVLRESLAQDPLAAVAPLLSEPHLSALDRRLAAVLQEVQTCQEKHSNVIFNDLELDDQHYDHRWTGETTTQ